MIGVVRTHESTRKLARKVEAGTARIRSATLSFQRGRGTSPSPSSSPDPDTGAARRRPGRRCRPGHQVTSPPCPPARRCPTRGGSTAQLRRCAAPSGTCVAAAWPGPAHPDRAVEPVAQGPRPRRPRPHPGGEPAPRRHPPAHHPTGPRPRRDRDRGPVSGRDAAQPAPGPAHRRRRLGGDPPPAHLQDRSVRGAPDRGGPLVRLLARPARDAARRKPSWACPSGSTCALACGIVLDRDVNAAPGTWPRCAADTARVARGSSPTEPVSDSPARATAVGPPREEPADSTPPP